MPVNFRAMKRRRLLLGMTQMDLSITAGVSAATIQKMENEAMPDGGGKTGVDVLMRLTQALRMDLREVLIAPEGNRYQRAVQFAAYQQDAAANPKLHDRSRTIRAENYRALTRGVIDPATASIISEEEQDAPAVDATPEPVLTYDWERDPSSE